MSNLFSKQQEPGCSCFEADNREWELVPVASAAFEANGSNNDMATLAKEMNELSVTEREQVLEELHGVAKVCEETPEFIADRIERVDQCLSELPKNSRKAMDRALFLRPGIATDSKFKLMFLRASNYDPFVVARRIAKYFDDKLKLFGEEKLVKDITLADLNKEDRKVLDLGFCLMLPEKDHTGRPIWFFDMKYLDLDNITSMLRAQWYMLMVTLEDETAQMKGVCDIAYCPGDMFALPAAAAGFLEMSRRSGEVLPNLPCRITSYHFCYNDPRVRAILSTIRVAFGKQVRLRLRTHYGSNLEMQYSMMTFGIRLDELLSPRSKERHAEIQRQFTEKRLEIERRRKEQERIDSEKSGMVLYPNPNDVLVGRGRLYRDFSGNVQWTRLVTAKLRSYGDCGEDKFAKTCISMDVVRQVRERGGRFLLPDKAGWKVVDDIAAREKTASLFRSKVAKASTTALGATDKLTAFSHFKMQQQQRDSLFPYGSRTAKRLRYDPNVAIF